MKKMYIDMDGSKLSLIAMCRKRPEWAASRIEVLEKQVGLRDEEEEEEDRPSNVLGEDLTPKEMFKLWRKAGSPWVEGMTDSHGRVITGFDRGILFYDAAMTTCFSVGRDDVPAFGDETTKFALMRCAEETVGDYVEWGN